MNTVKDLITRNVKSCSPDTSIQEVAQFMTQNHCGAIPVLDSNKRPVGIITDRDITTRAVAEGKNPLELRAADCMTQPVVTIRQENLLDDCVLLMEDRMIRRIVVIDETGRCTGILTQADIAEKGDEHETWELLHGVSRPTLEESRIH